MDDELERLIKIFGKVQRIDAHYQVHASAKIYPNQVKVFIPNDSYRKKIPFMEERVDELDGFVDDWETDVALSLKRKEDNLIRSIRRTKTLISDLVLCNEFDIFCTFTFSPEKADRQNPTAVKIQMANWLRNQRQYNGSFDYLIVPEFHKDGKSLHFHALFKEYTGELIDTGLKINGRKVYNFKSYTLGFNSAVPIDDINKVSGYVRKYITKDMPQFPGKRRFWASLGLKRPQIVENPDPDAWYMRATRDWSYKNEYGIIFVVTGHSSATESHSLTEDSPAPPPESEEV